jgi:hypothetical protein
VSADSLSVDCGGCVFTVSPVDGVHTGDRVCLAIRLDKVRRLGRDEAERFENKVSGKIDEVIFYGSIIKFFVSVPPGLRFLVEERMAGEDDGDAIGEKNIGETVHLGFQARDAQVLRENAEPNEGSP